MVHEHEPNLQLDGKIRCRTCGETVPSMEEQVGIVTSRVRANRILEEIAVAGHYQAKAYEEGFVIYGRDSNGSREEVTAKRINERSYRIIRRTITVE